MGEFESYMDFFFNLDNKIEIQIVHKTQPKKMFYIMATYDGPT